MFHNLFGKNKEEGERGEELPKQHEGLPDSTFTSGLCPRCGKQSSFEIIGSLPVTFENGYAVSADGRQSPLLLDRVSSLLCRHCLHAVVVIEEEWVGEKPKRERGKQSGQIHYRGIHWWPLPETKLSADIPSEIAGAFAEAATALHANCPRASVVMARRTLEAITVDNGEEEGTLAERIKNMMNKGILHPSLAEWVKEVRLVGNSGAHFDIIKSVSTEDAQQLLTFIRELLRYTYELPADLNRRRKSNL